jgi:uncharacterized protein
VIKLLSIYLLFSLGLGGGRELARAELAEVLPLLGITTADDGLAIPAWRTSSRGAWAASTSQRGGHRRALRLGVDRHLLFVGELRRRHGHPERRHLAAMVALMEFGVIYSLVIARVAMGRAAGGVRLATLLLSVMRGRGILLLLGGMLIGALATEPQWQQIQPFYEGLFRGMLMLFLLEMGITAARQIGAFREVGLFMPPSAC